MSDECKGYACPPSTTVDLPECEDGWEIGNGTAVCATQQPTTAPLAATGVDPLSLGLGAVIGLLLGLAGLALIRRGRRRERQAIHQAGLEAQREALAEVDAKLAAAGFVTMPDGSVRRVPTR